MRRLLILIMLAALGSLITTYALAQEEKRPTPADEWREIQRNYSNKQQEFFKAIQGAKTPEERQKVLQHQTDPKPFVERAIKLAEANPDSPVAADALFWAVQMARGSGEGKKAEELLAKGFFAKATLSEMAAKVQRYRLLGANQLFDAVLARVEAKTDDPAAAKLLLWINNNSMYGPPSQASEKATKLLMDKFINDDALATVCQNLGNNTSDTATNQLRTVLEKSSNKKVLASANFGLGMNLKEKEETTKEAETLFEKVVKDYANDNAAVANLAKSELREMRLLGIGKTVPEIEGKDLQEKEFKISDYRGKVVLIDFWGFW
jgi:hypothetical protein